MTAALRAAGERGYGSLSVAEVVRRSGESEGEFHAHFQDVRDCFAAAYAAEAGRLVGRLLDAASAQSSWREGLRAALGELAAFVIADPPLARALVIDVHVAGSPATEHRAELIEQLSRVIDRGRRKEDGRGSPPPLTAPLMVGAIEAAIVSALVGREPQSFARAVPELEQLIVAAYMPHDPERS